MIICSSSNIDIIQGVVAYGSTINANESILDWRLENSNVGVFNILNSSSTLPRISVIENGNIGVGTVPAPVSAKMEIIGDVNISGIFKKNNRDTLTDSSNYILSTSNILVSRINSGGGGSGGAITSGGNLTLSNNATSNTLISIQNSNVGFNFSSATTITPTGGTSITGQITSSIDKFMIFTAGTSVFTIPTGGINCDILMIGGGGGSPNGSGGGAGACIVAMNQTLSTGSCTVTVGASIGRTTGGDSSISVEGTIRYLAKGGGAGGNPNFLGGEGGCGGGAGFYNGGPSYPGGIAVSTNIVNGSLPNIGPGITATYAVLGNAGGNNGSSGNNSGSGGGIGTAGSTGGNGGNGAYQVLLAGSTTPINFRSYFANGGNNFGVQDGTTGNYYIGGGGASYNSTLNAYQAGGLGGGGNPINASYATANTGSGSTVYGGSGIIIIRYRIATLLIPSLELVRGILGDSNTDYKIGNYNGDFKIMSAISNTDTDRLIITSSGNVGIGTTNPANNLHMFDSLTNSTSLTIQNSNINFVATPVITPSGGTFSVGQITGSIDRFMIFTSGTSSFTVPTGGIICDILMIGGGGAGGYSGGGGGAGACIVAINQSFTTAGVYNVVVGAGDTANTTTTGAGADSTIGLNGGSTLYIAKGGGRGELGNNVRNNGGCGGGSGYAIAKTGGLAVNTNMVAGTIVDANSRSSTFAVFGNKGGDRPDSTSGVLGVGGGGIGGAGGNHIASSINAGPGGVGLFQATVGGMTYNFRSYFANGGTPYNFGSLNSVDSQYYIGGGGGSVQTSTKDTGPNVGGVGGVGGGGNGGIETTFNPSTGASAGPVNAVAGTGGTGGGGGGGRLNVNGGNGGSGIVIIRYRIAPVTIGVPSMELVRGIAGDSNHDYKVGNYDGNFKIMSAVSGTSDVERLNISSVGNVGIGTSSPANELHVFDNTTTATSLIIQNNNLVTTTNTTQATSTVQGSVTTGGITTFTADFTGSTAPSVHEAVSGSTTEKIMIFRTANTDHTFTVPSDGLVCDILMIGGGGSSTRQAGGGGAGACIVAINQILPAGSCVVRVGAGAITITSNGEDSYITVGGANRYRAKGGGCGGIFDTDLAGNAGGCGGGASYNRDTTVESGGPAVTTNVINGSQENIGPTGPTTGLGYVVLGNAGGNNNGETLAGSGGGIGVAGSSGGVGGNGAYQVSINGTTYNFRNHFANGSTTFGVQDGSTTNYYIGGGGGGWNNGGRDGGLGGGGGFWSNNDPSGTGKVNTGSGGGRGASGAEGFGGSGLIIIRYRFFTDTTITTTTYTHTPTLTTTTTSTLLGNSAIELVRGTQGDSNTDYKLGNYGGNFKVMSSTLSADTELLNVTPAGNVGIGTTSPQVKLHIGGEIYATGNIIAYYSDERLKTKISNIKESLEIVRKLNGFYYIPNDLARFNGIYNTDIEIGLSAQEVQRVLPEIVKIAPFDSVRNDEGVIVSRSGENYLTMSYERLIPVFVEAIKELKQKNIVLSQEITLIREKMKVICDKQKSDV